jgi:enoyl-CoA hydratase
MDDRTQATRQRHGRRSHEPARYERDLYSWAVEQAALLRAGRIADADAGKIAEELDDVGNEQYDKLESALRLILLHLLTWDRQPHRRSRSWRTSILVQRKHVQKVLRKNPGLKPPSARRSRTPMILLVCKPPAKRAWTKTPFRNGVHIPGAISWSGWSIGRPQPDSAGVPSSPDILFERRGVAGFVTLNRPQALNAVTHGMVRALAAQLARWEHDSGITRVVVTAAGEQAFSAGGDLRALYELGRAGRFEEALAFWRDEYRLNARIKHYRKPYVALVDGIVMGGGAGISINGSHRVAGDRFRFAMPEAGIGFFPDVGATWFLPRLPGEIGTWCALTGERLDAAAARACGIATHRVPRARWRDLAEGLCSAVPVDALLAAFDEPAAAEQLGAKRGSIDRLFQADWIESILDALAAEGEGGGADADFARSTAALIRAKSPTSVKIALAQLRAGRSLDFNACLRTEFRIVSRVVRGHDFYEGIRAVIIDKDQAPRWQPATLGEVSAAVVQRHFAPLAQELELP